MQKDPVCGQDIDPLRCKLRSEYGGEFFYFCSKSCRARFEIEPEHFLEPLSRSAGGADATHS